MKAGVPKQATGMKVHFLSKRNEKQNETKTKHIKISPAISVAFRPFSLPHNGTLRGSWWPAFSSSSCFFYCLAFGRPENVITRIMRSPPRWRTVLGYFGGEYWLALSLDFPFRAPVFPALTLINCGIKQIKAQLKTVKARKKQQWSIENDATKLEFDQRDNFWRK